MLSPKLSEAGERVLECLVIDFLTGRNVITQPEKLARAKVRANLAKRGAGPFDDDLWDPGGRRGEKPLPTGQRKHNRHG